MFGSRVTCSARNSICSCRCLIHNQVSHTFAMCFKQFHVSKATCFTTIGNMYIHCNFYRHNQFYRTKYHMPSALEQDKESKLEIKENVLKNNTLHSDEHVKVDRDGISLNILHNVYYTVAQKLNEKKLDIFIEKLIRNERPFYKCTLSVYWPSNNKFEGTGHAKKIAVQTAARKCLDWLRFNKFIVNDKPVLFLRGEEKIVPVKVKIQSKFKTEIQEKLDTYNRVIKDLIAATGTSDIHTMLEKKDDTIDQIEESDKYEHLIHREQDNDVIYSKWQFSYEECPHLPIYRYREKILNAVEKNKIVLIKGETGCGKTVLVPQFILDHFARPDAKNACRVIVVQPRRIAATSIAMRVAGTRHEVLGDSIGYQVRLCTKLPQTENHILFCTYGILLRRLEGDPDLQEFSHVILDELHERQVDMDMAMLLLKQTMNRRKDLKIVLMSATIHTEQFEKYFDCSTVHVPGQAHYVKRYFLEDIQKFYTTDTFTTVNRYFPEVLHKRVSDFIQWICTNKPPGAILCFLPGMKDLQAVERGLNSNDSKQKIILLHSSTKGEVLDHVFRPVPAGVRKIILATDIAESSITIAEVIYVIDTAIKRVTHFERNRSVISLRNSWISQANIRQRAGRAGRVAPGESYLLISEAFYSKLRQYPVPEINRTSLEIALLFSKMYGSFKAADFFSNMIESPPADVLQNAIKTLKSLDAIDSEERLKPLGRRMTYLMMHPIYSKTMIYSAIFQCIAPVATVITVYNNWKDLDGEIPSGHKKRMLHKTSDHIAISNHFNNVITQDVAKTEDPILQTFMLYRNQALAAVKSGHMICQDINIHENQFSNDNEMVRAVIYAATNNLAIHQLATLRDKMNKKVNLVSSVNSNKKTWASPFFTYFTLAHDTDIGFIIRDSSMISPLTVLLFSQGDIRYLNRMESKHYIPRYKKQDISFTIGDSKHMQLSCNAEMLNLLVQLRSVIWDIINYFVEQQGVCRPEDAEKVKQVGAYKQELFILLSKMLQESSKDIDAPEYKE